MTYAVRLKTGAAGVTVVGTAGDVPEGEFEITGHDDGTNRNITVLQRDHEGRFVTWAQHNRHPEEPG